MKRILAVLAGAGFALVLPFSVVAAPFSVSLSTPQALPGSFISATLEDSAAIALEAVDLQVSFDPAYLSLVGAVAGTLTPSASIGVNTATGRISVVQLDATSGAGSIVVAQFQVLPGSPFGPTLVGFQSTSTDYVVPLKQATQIVAVPEPRMWATFVVGLALVGMRVASRAKSDARGSVRA